jgi:hypothetical protein
LGHRRPGKTETYAELAPDYLGEGRVAIDARFEERALSYAVLKPGRTSDACHSADGRLTSDGKVQFIS